MIKMNDIYDATVLCSNCNKETVNGIAVKNGFRMRVKECQHCGETWMHPGDIQEYKNFMQLKSKNFRVKLRIVGNSYTVSIPREIVEFYELKKERMVDMALNEPKKITLIFSRITRKVYQNE